MGWTIFTVIDLGIGVLMLELMATAVPKEKLGRLRVVRNIALGLLVVSGIVLVVQAARQYGWMKP